MKFKIVTPAREMLDVEIDSLTVPTQNGEITILKNHVPLVSNLKAGELRYKAGGQEHFFALSGGVVEVRDGGMQVVVLADTAEFGHEIDIDRAEKARDLAAKMMQENYHDQSVSAEAVGLLEKNIARLKVAKKHRTHTRSNLESGVFHE